MIAFVDDAVNDQKSIRISTNIHCRWRKLSRQLWIINKKTIDADSNTYRFARKFDDYTSFANLSMIFFAYRFVFDTNDTQKFSIAMKNRQTNKDRIFVWFKSVLKRFQQLSLSNLNFSEIRKIFHVFSS